MQEESGQDAFAAVHCILVEFDLLPPLLVPVRGPGLIVDLAALVVHDDGRLRAARNGIGAWLSSLLARVRVWGMEGRWNVHTSANVRDDDSVTAAASAGEGGIGLVDLVRHCDVVCREREKREEGRGRWRVVKSGGRSIDIVRRWRSKAK